MSLLASGLRLSSLAALAFGVLLAAGCGASTKHHRSSLGSVIPVRRVEAALGVAPAPSRLKNMVVLRNAQTSPDGELRDYNFYSAPSLAAFEKAQPKPIGELTVFSSAPAALRASTSLGGNGCDPYPGKRFFAVSGCRHLRLGNLLLITLSTAPPETRHALTEAVERLLSPTS